MDKYKRIRMRWVYKDENEYIRMRMSIWGWEWVYDDEYERMRMSI